MTAPRKFSELKTAKKPVRRTVRIPTDDELAGEYGEAQQKLEIKRVQAKARPKDVKAAKELEDAQVAFDELKEAVQENHIKFVFRSIGRQAFEDMVLRHPPTTEQMAEVEKRGQDPKELSFNPDTMFVELIAASCEDPEFTQDEAKQLWSDPDWNQSELAAIFQCALEANIQRRVIDLGKG